MESLGESVGHFQTRQESGRIFGMKVTQASPQIPRHLESLLKPLSFNIFRPKTTDF
jgi:hypothetical protein